MRRFLIICSSALTGLIVGLGLGVMLVKGIHSIGEYIYKDSMVFGYWSQPLLLLIPCLGMFLMVRAVMFGERWLTK